MVKDFPMHRMLFHSVSPKSCKKKKKKRSTCVIRACSPNLEPLVENNKTQLFSVVLNQQTDLLRSIAWCRKSAKNFAKASFLEMLSQMVTQTKQNKKRKKKNSFHLLS
jgi:hypothetical protein